MPNWNPDPWPAPKFFEISSQEPIPFDNLLWTNQIAAPWLIIVQQALVRANQRIKSRQGKSLNVNIHISSPSAQLLPETDEGYTMTLESTNLVIQSKTVFGTVRALSTFTQFVSPDGLFIRPMKVVDSPQFSHRGIMLDTARHYFSVDAILRLLSGMEIVRMNRLHWHIFDSQSFPLAWNDPARLNLPQLYQLGAFSPSSIYTVQDVHRILSEAHLRGIIVIPEFELVAHNDILVLAYPEITSCNPNPKKPSGQINPFAQASYDWISRFMKFALDECFINSTGPIPFGCPLIHIGCDEIHKWCWEIVCPPGKPYDFPSTISQLLNHIFREIKLRNRQIISWADLVLPSECNVTLPKDVIIQCWRDASNVSQALSLGHRVIVSPASPYYFTPGSWIKPGTGSVSMKSAYQFRLQPREEASGKVIGGEACIWTEETTETVLDKVIWPRCAVIAERFWKNGDIRDYLSENRVNVLNSWLKQVNIDPWEASTVME